MVVETFLLFILWLVGLNVVINVAKKIALSYFFENLFVKMQTKSFESQRRRIHFTKKLCNLSINPQRDTFLPSRETQFICSPLKL